jgi:hypothetical protein
MSLCCSGSASPMYPGEAMPVGPGFVGPRSIEEQTEPVDFSTANEPVNFSSGVRPVPAFPPATGTAGGYSRESTPDSGGSHYLDTYRDANGKEQYRLESIKIWRHDLGQRTAESATLNFRMALLPTCYLPTWLLEIKNAWNYTSTPQYAFKARFYLKAQEQLFLWN